MVISLFVDGLFGRTKGAVKLTPRKLAGQRWTGALRAACAAGAARSTCQH